MSMKYTPIALFICSSLVLTACSGGSNKSTAIPSSPKVLIHPSQNESDKKTEANKVAESSSKSTSEAKSNSDMNKEKPSLEESGKKTSEATLESKSESKVTNEMNKEQSASTEKKANPENMAAEKKPENTGKQENKSEQPKESKKSDDASTALISTQADKKVEDAGIETILDTNKKIKWRQITAFIPSSDSEVDNPLSELANGKISLQKGAAAYINGDARYSDNGTKDFRDPKNRQSTSYDPEFLTKAEIDPNKLQSYTINNSQGNKVASAHFVNQKYSSYLSWKSEQPAVVYDEPVETVMAGYVAVPTNADTAILDRKVKATYKGHTIGNKDRSGNEFTLGNIQLDADFEKMQISGMITGRNDELLNHRATYQGSGFKQVTTDPEEVEEGYTSLITEAEMKQRYEQHRKLDVTLLPADIKVENGVIGFKRSSDALEFKALNGDKVTTGSYGGIFAGPNAEEVVGEIQGSDNFISFGATEVQK